MSGCVLLPTLGHKLPTVRVHEVSFLTLHHVAQSVSPDGSPFAWEVSQGGRHCGVTAELTFLLSRRSLPSFSAQEAFSCSKKTRLATTLGSGTPQVAGRELAISRWRKLKHANECQALWDHVTTINSFNLQQPCEVGTVVSFIVQVGKLRPREVTSLRSQS